MTIPRLLLAAAARILTAAAVITALTYGLTAHAGEVIEYRLGSTVGFTDDAKHVPRAATDIRVRQIPDVPWTPVRARSVQHHWSPPIVAPAPAAPTTTVVVVNNVTARASAVVERRDRRRGRAWVGR